MAGRVVGGLLTLCYAPPRQSAPNGKGAANGLAELLLKITPSDAHVTVDGVRLGLKERGRVAFTRLSPGRHVIEARKEGYAHVQKIFDASSLGVEGRVRLAPTRRQVTVYLKAGGKLTGTLLSRAGDKITVARGDTNETLGQSQYDRIELGPEEPVGESYVELWTKTASLAELGPEQLLPTSITIPTELCEDHDLSWSVGQWLGLDIILVRRRLVILAGPGLNQGGHSILLPGLKRTAKEPVVKVRDMSLPDWVPAEGHVCFQMEEHGNARLTCFDNVYIREATESDRRNLLCAGFLLKERFRADSLSNFEIEAGAWQVRFETFTGAWQVSDGILACPEPCLSWPTIRTKGEYRDFAMHVDILRGKIPATNWAGIGLRTKATGTKFGDSVRVVVLQARGGDRTELVVQPMEKR